MLSPFPRIKRAVAPVAPLWPPLGQRGAAAAPAPGDAGPSSARPGLGCTRDAKAVCVPVPVPRAVTTPAAVKAALSPSSTQHHPCVPQVPEQFFNQVSFFQRLHVKQYKPQDDPLCPSSDRGTAGPRVPWAGLSQQSLQEAGCFHGRQPRPKYPVLRIPPLQLLCYRTGGHFHHCRKDLRFLTLQDKQFLATGNQNTMATDCMEADSVLFQGKLQRSKSCNNVAYKITSLSRMFDKLHLLKHGCSKLPRPLMPTGKYRINSHPPSSCRAWGRCSGHSHAVLWTNTHWAPPAAGGVASAAPPVVTVTLYGSESHCVAAAGQGHNSQRTWVQVWLQEAGGQEGVSSSF